MPLVKNKLYKFAPSVSPDVASYKLYFHLNVEGEQLYAFAYTDDYMPILNIVPGIDGNVAFDLSGMIAADGDTFDLAITAVDGAGNESDFGGVMRAVPLDFTAPEAPGSAFIAAS